MKLKYKFVVQKVSDGFVAVPVGNKSGDFSGIVRMNRTSAFIFEQLKDNVTVDELVKWMAEKYDADEATLRENAETFVNQLKAEGLLA